MPERKSLFGKQNRRGLPIGNLTSQFWANVYLDELDQHVKRTLRVRHYVRYVDDLVLLSESPAELEAWHAEIERFLRERLHLALRADRARPRPVCAGIDFVGWRTWWSHRLPRRRTLGALRARLDAFAGAAVRVTGGGPGRAVWAVDLRAAPRRAPRQRAAASSLPSTAAEELAAALASYAGHLRHGAAWHAWQALWRERPWLDLIFARSGFAVAERFPRRAIARAQGLRRRYWGCIRSAGERCLVFYPVGCFVELRGPQRQIAEAALGLRSARLPRGGWRYACGFPRRASWRWRARALAAGLAVAELGARSTLPERVLASAARPR